MTQSTEVKKKLVFIFNGPPNSGKDYAAKIVTDTFQDSVQLEFKKALREVAHHMASLHHAQANWEPDTGLDTAITQCDNVEYSFDKSDKDTLTFPAFGDRTWRQFLIWISETVMKPIFGQDIFGRAAAKLVQETDASIIAFSDGGFQVEVDELLKLEGVTVVVLQLKREGYDWGNDSRGYIQAKYLIDTWTVRNNERFSETVRTIVAGVLLREDIPYAYKT